jgi:hypothetical protein
VTVVAIRSPSIFEGTADQVPFSSRAIVAVVAVAGRWKERRAAGLNVRLAGVSA